MPPFEYLIPGLLRAEEMKAKKAAEAAKQLTEEPAKTEQATEEKPTEAEQPTEKEPVPPTPVREAMHEIQAEALEEVAETEQETEAEPVKEPVPPTPVREAMHEIQAEALEAIAEPQLPSLSPSPEREAPKLGLGGTVADPANETRKEFLERARKKLKCPMAKIVQKAKAVEGLWELWPEEEETVADRKRKAEPKAAPKAKAKAAPKEEPAPKRGRPCSKASLRCRLAAGGDIESVEEWEGVPNILKVVSQQHRRMVQSGKVQEAQGALDEQTKIYEAADRWADANGVARVKRVEQRHAANQVLFKAGIQMITTAYRNDGELLAAELRLQKRSEQS